MGVQTITDSAGFDKLESNTILGVRPTLKKSSIVFEGEGNILYCEEGLVLDSSRIKFAGNNAVACLCASKHPLKLSISIWSSSSFYVGRDHCTRGVLHAVASERQAILIGDDSLFSFGIWIRTADPHTIYSCATMERVNPSKPVCIGDHVWIGQDALILKGTTIGSGSILGGGTVCPGKRVPSNTSWAGNPARQIASDVFFSKASVHDYSPEQTEKSQHFKKDSYVYVNERPSERLSLSHLAKMLADTPLPDDKLALMQAFFDDNQEKGRFAILS